tara:strand:+ start:1658 stop:1867 length:210 start_codon:yes stop_codon:yes gene_type:complete
MQASIEFVFLRKNPKVLMIFCSFFTGFLKWSGLYLAYSPKIFNSSLNRKNGLRVQWEKRKINYETDTIF